MRNSRADKAQQGSTFVAKVLFWIIVAPLAAVVIVFSVNNRTEIRLDLWPLDAMSLPFPVFLIVLASMLAGFLAGGFIAWRSAGRSRLRARAQAGRADQAERELATAEDRIERLLSEAETAAYDIPQLPPAA